MTRPPATRAPLAHVAPSSNVRHDPAYSASVDPGATQRVCVEALRRISNLHADFAAELGGLAQILEETVAHCGETSLIAPLPEIATPERDLLTSTDLANLLQCHPRTLRRRELLGELPAPIRTGRRKRWLRATVDVWLADREGNLR